jgi:hypothetical protein
MKKKKVNKQMEKMMMMMKSRMKESNSVCRIDIVNL